VRIERDPALSWERKCSFGDINSRGRSRFTCRRAFHCSPSRVSILFSFIQSAGNGTAENARPRAACGMHGSGAKKEKSRRTLSRPLFSLSLIVLSPPSIPLVLLELCRFAQRSRFLPIASSCLSFICFRDWKSCEAKMYEAEISLGQSRARGREFSRESNRATEPLALLLLIDRS